ncbi:MAG TPA: tetratricopeptide repeat protein, partial [Vicinamibacteria bacterium]|nr:tetratricopeptide repeat protein [Vicinamibacteria bacterium]
QIQIKLGEAYLGAKKIEEAEGVFRKLLQQDPQDQDARIQMARVQLFKNRFDEAFDQLLPVVDRFMEKKEGEKAAALLQQVVQRNEGHVKSLVKLVEVYRLLRKESAVAATYQQLSEAYIREGQMGQAASVLEILVEMDPQNAQHRSKLDFVRGKSGGAAAAAAAPSNKGFVQSATGEFFEEDLELEAEPATLEADIAVAAPAAAPSRTPAVAARPTIELSPPHTGEDREFIDEHLAEGRVFRKYGLQDKAADQFLAVIARFPDHAEARQELRDVYKDKADKAKAAEQCLALAEISRLKGDPAGAKQHEADAEALVPRAAPPPEPAAPAPPPPPPAPAQKPETRAAKPAPPSEPEPELEPESTPELESEEDISLEVEEGGLETPEEEPAGDLGPLDLGVEPAGQDIELSGGFIDEDAAPQEELDLGAPEPEAPEPPPLDTELDLEPEPELPPPPPVPRAATRPAVPSRPVPAARPAAPAKAAPPRPSRIQPRPAAARPAPPSLALKRGLVPKAAAPAPATRGVPPELQRALDEVEQYVSLGFVDDAKDALADLGGRFPDHPAVAAKMAELGLEAAVEAPKPPGRGPVSPPAAAAPAPPAPPPPPKARPPVASMPPLEEEPEAEDDELSDLVGDVPEMPEAPLEPETAALAADDPFGELGLEEPAPVPLGLDDNPFADIPEPEPEPQPEPEPDGPSLDLGFGDPESEVDAPSLGEPASDGGSSLDLGAELDGLFETQAAVPELEEGAGSTDLGDAGLADIFKEFKKGVDKQLGKEDYDTRYNLGIAYKEM